MGHRYDMVVIGAGPAGEKAANQAAYFGKSVALVDRSETPGGTAVSLGGVPTKTLRDTALYVTGFRRRDVYGVSLGLDPDVIVRHLRARAEDVVANMAEVVRENLERHRVAFVRGEARLAPGGRVMVETAGGGTRELEAPVILVATGSHPFHPPDVPFEDPDVLDSDTVLDLDRPFSDLVVVGGGAVGCEYASIFTALGVRVTLVDRAPRLLPFMDEEISHLLADAFRDAGMRVLLGTGGAAIRRDDEGLLVAVRDAVQGDDGEGEILRPDKVLFAAGRAGDVRGLGLADVGVDVDERGRIVVDGRYRTSAPGIWAAGDVIGPPALASVSMEQGRVAACYAFDIPFKRTVDPLPPFGVYSIPEASMVGMTEQQAAARRAPAVPSASAAPS